MKAIYCLIACFCLGGANTSSAQGNSQMAGPSPAPLRTDIAAINFNRAVLETAEARRELGAFQQKYAPREAELQKLNNDVEILKKTLNAQSTQTTEAERNHNLQDLEVKEKQLQRKAEDLKNDSQMESQQVFQQVAQKLFSFLQEFSQQHGYTAVLDRGTDATPIVWYAAKNVDITELIIRSYDTKYGSGAPALPDTPRPKNISPSPLPKQP